MFCNNCTIRSSHCLPLQVPLAVFCLQTAALKFPIVFEVEDENLHRDEFADALIEIHGSQLTQERLKNLDSRLWRPNWSKGRFIYKHFVSHKQRKNKQKQNKQSGTSGPPASESSLIRWQRSSFFRQQQQPPKQQQQPPKQQ